MYIHMNVVVFLSEPLDKKLSHIAMCQDFFVGIALGNHAHSEMSQVRYPAQYNDILNI